MINGADYTEEKMKLIGMGASHVFENSFISSTFIFLDKTI